MKKFVVGLGIIVLLLPASISYAGSLLFDNATSVGTGQAKSVKKASSYTVVATFANTSSLTLTLDGSIDNATYPVFGAYSANSADIANGYVIFHVNDKVAEHIRPRITTLTGGGASVDVTVSYK
jgi:hypothetical protein